MRAFPASRTPVRGLCAPRSTRRAGDGAAGTFGGRDGARRVRARRRAYQFVGFLPRGEKALADLWAELRGWRWPTVAFESPQRLPATLRSLAAADPEREVAVCRELTKRFEEVVRGTAAELSARFAEPPKGELTLVLGPGRGRTDADEGAALAAVSELVEAGVPRKRAAELVARLNRRRERTASIAARCSQD